MRTTHESSGCLLVIHEVRVDVRVEEGLELVGDLVVDGVGGVVDPAGNSKFSSRDPGSKRSQNTPVAAWGVQLGCFSACVC